MDYTRIREGMRDDFRVVGLTGGEVRAGTALGIERHFEAERGGRRNSLDYRQLQDWGAHIVGALGELAFAKAMEVFMPYTLNTYKVGGDVGMFQIRTRYAPHWELPIRDRELFRGIRNDLSTCPHDRDEDPFVLVTGPFPVLGQQIGYTFHVVGWITAARDGKRPENVCDPGKRNKPVYLVKQKDLRPIEELFERIAIMELARKEEAAIEAERRQPGPA